VTVVKALIPTHHSRGIARIVDALAAYAPPDVSVIGRPAPPRKDSKKSTELVGEQRADLIVLTCNGMRDHYQAIADRCLSRGQAYAVVQIALRTTRHPRTEQWRRLWSQAAVVWSYYPLDLWIREDAATCPSRQLPSDDGLGQYGVPTEAASEPEALDFHFYHAPLGVDPAIFHPNGGGERSITVCTSGARRNQESVAECDEAALAVDGCVFQLGAMFALRARAIYAQDLTDDVLAAYYRQCQFVSGLRRQEGFELPAAEGLLCGARPILYDREHYRSWYDGFGEFVREDSHESVVEQLKVLFSNGARPVTVEERERAVHVFSWKRIVEGFWNQVL
jgi:hypothetical protein